ncbi:MAG: hypothetical protein J0L84_11535 [Verrucomicrobia bacterium]|nr:hypothetical protein [Verrucomicrobiota bacterium]
MNSVATSFVVLSALLAAIFLGSRLRRRLPDSHRDSETKDAVKLAMGMVATMSALLLGLLVSSAKSSYDSVRSQVIQMGANVQFLDRVLRIYGPESQELRIRFHGAIESAIGEMWSEREGAAPPDVHTGDALYGAIQGLAPRDEVQRALKAQAVQLAVDLAQRRTLLHAQSVASISRPLLVMVVVWLVIILFSFSLVAPRNATAFLAQVVAAFAVTGAIYLILEMDRPFSGLVHVSSAPLANALIAIRP